MRPFTIASLAALVLAAGAASAQDVELYDRPGFTGTRLTIGQDTPDLAPYGFAGRVGSVIVRRGHWEFCTAIGYRGVCVAVGPGRYAELPPAFRSTLESVRNASASMTEAGRGPTQPFPVPGGPPAPPHPREAIVLFELSDYAGHTLGLSAPSARLSDHQYNDFAQAVEVRRGRWQFCEHADFGGECQVYGPGRHIFAGALRGMVSSVRPVSARDHRPLPALIGVILYEHADHLGRELELSAAVPDLAALGFNDVTSSLEVIGGRWELCTDARHAGRCVLLGPGRHNIERSLNDRISSVRPR